MIRELERMTIVSPLGIRFWDVPTARPVVDGLRLTDAETGRPAIPNRSGVFVVPGRRDMQGAGDAAYWASPPGERPMQLELTDAWGRFHDVRFDAVAPHRGVFAEACGSPPHATPAVPLFSLPSRPPPAGFAVIRAELIESLTPRRPAALAVLEVSAAGVETAYGIADREGRVLVLLPYPEPPWHGDSPPPGTRPLSAQTWPVDLAVRYSPGSPPDVSEPPDVRAVLEQEPAALAPIDAAELEFGRDLLLETLLVTPPA